MEAKEPKWDVSRENKRIWSEPVLLDEDDEMRYRREMVPLNQRDKEVYGE